MSSYKLYSVCTAMLLLWGNGMAHAADDFDPGNPPEPQTSYRLEVTATPDGVASVSGIGLYQEGTRVYVNSSVKDTDYRFVKWLMNGVDYTTNRNFYYTMTAVDVAFTAVYEYVEFNPGSPDDPNLDYRWRLYLTAQPEEACSFNLDTGSRQIPNSWVEVNAYTNQGFVFDGWYENGVIISDVTAFNYEMPANNAYLTARFHFMPESPADPNSTLPPAAGIPGDVNGDDVIDSQDMVTSINGFINDVEYSRVLDINNDGIVDVQDTIAVINYFLNSR